MRANAPDATRVGRRVGGARSHPLPAGDPRDSRDGDKVVVINERQKQAALLETEMSPRELDLT